MEISLMLIIITIILTLSSLLETTQSRMFLEPALSNLMSDVFLSDNEHEAVKRPSDSPPPSPKPSPSTRQASHSSVWPFPLSTTYYIDKFKSFIIPPTIIGGIGGIWYGRDSPKSPPSPTANTPGRQIDADQYVAATGGYRRPDMVRLPPPCRPAVIGLTFSRASLQEPHLDEFS